MSIVKKIIYNILFLIIFLIIIELIAIYKYSLPGDAPFFKFFPYEITTKLRLFKPDFDYLKYWIFRENEYGDSNKKAVILIGCSYTYGENLEDNQTFSHLLSKYTHRTVYNWGIYGGSPREALYILRNQEIRKTLNNDDRDVEYVIYTYITNHMERIMYREFLDIVPSFKYKNNRLEYSRAKTILENSSRFHYLFMQEVVLRRTAFKKKFLALITYVREINKEVKKLYPNAKFVLLVYENLNDEDLSFFEKEGIKVIYLEKLTNTDLKTEKYRLPDSHPNEKAWQLIVPKLSKELNL